MKKLILFALLLLPLLAFAQTNTGGGGGTGTAIYPQYTVATLPAVHPTYQIVWVTDGASATDCTVGLGTTKVLCYWNGSAWTAISSGGGGAGTVTNTGTLTAGKLAGGNGATDIKVDSVLTTDFAGTITGGVSATFTTFVGALTGNATTATDTASKSGTGSTYPTTAGPTIDNPLITTRYRMATNTAGYRPCADGNGYVPCAPIIALDSHSAATCPLGVAQKTQDYTCANNGAQTSAFTVASLSAGDYGWVSKTGTSGDLTITPSAGTCSTSPGTTESACVIPNGSRAMWVYDGSNINFTVALPVVAGTGLLAAAVSPLANISVTTSTPVTVSTSLASVYHFNQHATAATAIVYNLPPTVVGKQECFANSYNGSAANTGTLTITPAASSYIIKDGTLSTISKGWISGGAAGDAACVVANDATHWTLYVNKGTWTAVP